MATTNKVTRFVALSTLIEFAKANNFDNAEVMEIVEKMCDKLKTPSKVGTTTHTAKSNDKFFDAHVDVFANGTVLTAREYANVIDGFPCDINGRPSIHKATAILIRAVNEGKLVKVPSEKKSAPMSYKLA
jgi:hypothetical protein